jgi:hypothetical protein
MYVESRRQDTVPVATGRTAGTNEMTCLAYVYHSVLTSLTVDAYLHTIRDSRLTFPHTCIYSELEARLCLFGSDLLSTLLLFGSDLLEQYILRYIRSFNFLSPHLTKSFYIRNDGT